MVDAVLSFEGDARPPFPHPARGEEPLRPDRRDRRVRDDRTAACARCRTPPSCSSPGATPPPPGTAVFAGMEGTRPLLVEIQALVAPIVARHAAPRRRRLGSEPPVDGARRARGPWRPAARQARRLPQRRRRPAHHRAGRRPRGGRGARLLALGRAAARPNASISARSAFRARSGRSARRRRGSRRPQSSASPAPWSPRAGGETRRAPAIRGSNSSAHVTDLVAGIAAAPRQQADAGAAAPAKPGDAATRVARYTALAGSRRPRPLRRAAAHDPHARFTSSTSSSSASC